MGQAPTCCNWRSSMKFMSSLTPSATRRSVALLKSVADSCPRAARPQIMLQICNTYQQQSITVHHRADQGAYLVEHRMAVCPRAPFQADKAAPAWTKRAQDIEFKYMLALELPKVIVKRPSNAMTAAQAITENEAGDMLGMTLSQRHLIRSWQRPVLLCNLTRGTGTGVMRSSQAL